MNKNNKVDKKRIERIAGIVLCVLMVVWTIGSIFGIVAFARSNKEDSMVVASALTESNVLNGDPYVYMIPSGTEFVIRDDDSSGAWVDFYRYSTEFIPMDLSIYDYHLPVNLVRPDSLIDPSYQLDVMYYFINSNDNLVIANDYYFVCYRDLRYFADPSVLAYYRLSAPMFDGQWQFDSISFTGESYFYYFPYFQDAFENEYRTGYDEGYDEGYNVGVEKGAETGYEDGFYAGKIEGAASANEYSFNGLISSVIDVPIKAFRSLFNFELLGINLTNFFLSLLTVCIILAVIRFIL